jgi:hypothetical protein
MVPEKGGKEEILCSEEHFGGLEASWSLDVIFRGFLTQMFSTVKILKLLLYKT